jgi:hypothetical protein
MELGRAYRALRGYYGCAVKGRPVDATMRAYHAPTVGAAIRFVHEESLDGADYFVGKPIQVLHDVLQTAEL